MVPVAELVAVRDNAGGVGPLAHRHPRGGLHVPYHGVVGNLQGPVRTARRDLEFGRQWYGGTGVRVAEDGRVVHDRPYVLAVQVGEPGHRVPGPLVDVLDAHPQGVVGGVGVYCGESAGYAHPEVVYDALHPVPGRLQLLAGDREDADRLVHPDGHRLLHQGGALLLGPEVAREHGLGELVQARVLVVPELGIVESGQPGKPRAVHLGQRLRVVPLEVGAAPPLRVQVPAQVGRIRAVYDRQRLVQVPVVAAHLKARPLQLPGQYLPGLAPERVVVPYEEPQLNGLAVQRPHAGAVPGRAALGHGAVYESVGPAGVVAKAEGLQQSDVVYVLGIKGADAGHHGRPQPVQQLVHHQVAVHQIVQREPHVPQGERVEHLGLGGVGQYAVCRRGGFVHPQSLPVPLAGQPLGGQPPKVHVYVAVAHVPQGGVLVQIPDKLHGVKAGLGVGGAGRRQRQHRRHGPPQHGTTPHAPAWRFVF